MHHRLPSDTLIYDLQFRLKCRHCKGRRGNFEIAFEPIEPNVSNEGFADRRIVVVKRR
jgi:hypothetical protein